MNETTNWDRLIDEAIGTKDPFLSNFKITRLHWLLSNALSKQLGPEAGANFHSWAVWGSRKAGVTIRQADRDQASRDAVIVAGIVGGLIGIGVGWLLFIYTSFNLAASIGLWALAGIVCGGFCGWMLAGYTRSRAALLILQGNQLVLADIGRVTASYLEYVASKENGTTTFEEWRNQLPKGDSESGGQDLLARAFTCYETARLTDEPVVQHEQVYFGNCLAVLHEHYKLQPIIKGCLPFLISRCVTQRLMTYSVGETQLAVHDDVPPLYETPFPPSLMDISDSDLKEFLHGSAGWDGGRDKLINTRANDWTDLRERMGYIVNLFRTRHLSPDVVASPYSENQLAAIAAGKLPEPPW